MAVTAVIGNPSGAINYTFTTDTSADFASVANSTYFYNKADKIVRYKDATGNILEIFSVSGGVHMLTAPVVGRIYSSTINGAGGSTSVTATDRITFLPFLPLTNLITSSFNINVTIASAGSLAKVLVFDNVSGNPKNKLFESVNLDCSTTGIKSVTAGSFTFIAGSTYWIGIISNQSGVTYSGYSSTQMLPISINSVGGVSNFALFTVSYPFASVPSIVTDTNFSPIGSNVCSIYMIA